MIRTACALFTLAVFVGTALSADKDVAKAANNKMVKGTVKSFDADSGVLIVNQELTKDGKTQVVDRELTIKDTTRFVIIVDEDINPRDPHEVFWAIGTRCDPATAIQVISGLRSTPLDPAMPPEKKERGDLTSSCAIINACKPYEWKDEFPITNIASPEQRQAVLTKWKDLF